MKPRHKDPGELPSLATDDKGPDGAPSRSKLLWYFNGFNSAIPADWSDNEKIMTVEAYARKKGFRFRPYSVNYRQAREHAADILRLCERAGDDDAGVKPHSGTAAVVFSGSSMGGWFARILQLLLGQARPELRTLALAFNPAFDLGLHHHMLLGPQVNHVTLETYDWTERDGMQLKGLEESVDYDAPLPFFVYVDKGDEVIGWEYSAARHGRMARFLAFEGGSHSFEHAREAMLDFDRNARL